MGNASSFLNGIQAKRVSFNDPCAEISGPQSAKPGLFSGEPAYFFTGVVAGTEGSSLRRWNSGKGTASRNGGSQDVFLEPLPVDQVVSGTGDVEPFTRRWEKRSGSFFRPVGRRVRAERSEAGSEFASQFCPCDPPLVRLNRVNDIICESQSRFQSCFSQNSLTHNSHSTFARSLHAVHDARCVQNSLNSLGDGVVRGRGVCVLKK